MSNVVKLRTEEAIIEEASLWIARLDRQLSEAEQVELKAWLGADERHHEAFLEMAELWDRMDVLSLLADVASAPGKQKSSVWLGWAAALLIGCGLWFSLQPIQAWLSPDTVIVLNEQVYSTTVGEQRTVKLADKSVLTLNTNSSVIVTYTNQQRLIQMQRGELHIKVAHDTARPLSVYAAGNVIQAVGTAFNVYVEQDDVKVTVTDGTVLVAQQDASRRDPIHPKELTLPESALRLTQGQFSEISAAKPVVETLQKDDLMALVSWQQGKLIFNGETLAEAMLQVSRYSHVEFTIDDPALAAIPVVGLFRNDDLKGVLFALQENFAVQHVWLNNHTIALRASEKQALTMPHCCELPDPLFNPGINPL